MNNHVIGHWKLRTAIVALVLLVRVVYVLIAPQLDPILRRDPLYGDASGYNLLALNLLKGLGLTWDGQMPTSYRMPGYPAFLALLYALVGPNLISVRLAQAALGAMTCIPILGIAGRFGSNRIYVLVGLGLVLHPILTYITGWLYSETLFLLIFWSGIYVLARTLANSNGWKSAIAAGIILGMATLVRPEIAILPSFIFVIALLLRWSRRELVKLVLVELALVVVLFPWVVRNTMVHGTPVLLTTNSGANLYAGNSSLADGGFRLDLPFVLPGFSEVDSDKEFLRRALKWISANPVSFVSLVPAKLAKFLSPAEMVSQSEALGRWTLPLNVSQSVYLLLAIWGAIVRHGKTVMLLEILVAWYALTAIVFFGGTRLGLPAAPSLVILAACGLESILGSRKVQESAVTAS